MVLRRLFLRIKVKVSVFLVLKGFFDSVQYRKILHTCITLIYMAIYFGHTINVYTYMCICAWNTLSVFIDMSH